MTLNIPSREEVEAEASPAVRRLVLGIPEMWSAQGVTHAVDERLWLILFEALDYAGRIRVRMAWEKYGGSVPTWWKEHEDA